MNTTAIITGGASGLGEATAVRLYAAGANVVLADFNEEKGKALAEKLGDRAAFALTDVTNTAQVQAAVDLAISKFGRVDIVINCAGTGIAMRTISKSGPHNIDLFRKVIDINLVGTFDMIRLAVEKMVVNEPNSLGERGVIINTASVAAYDGQIGQAAYSASKAGVVGFVQSWHQGVHYCPGAVRYSTSLRASCGGQGFAGQTGSFSAEAGEAGRICHAGPANSGECHAQR